MSSPTIPFGPDTEPLGLAADDFEFISLDGPQEALDNESLSEKKDGAFLRWVATRKVTTYTANYTILDGSASLPATGLYNAAAGGIGGNVWIRNVNVSKPQAGDRTLAVTYAQPADVTATEGLETDFTTIPTPTPTTP